MSEAVIIKSDPNQTRADLKAIIASYEANPVAPDAPDVSTPPAVNAPAPVTPTEKPVLPTPEITPPVEEKPKVTQQPQDATEKAVSEPPKTAEPVKETDWKEAYKGLQRTVNKLTVELKAKGETTATPAPVVEPVKEPIVGLSTEFRQKFTADLEKDPVEALIRLNQLMIQEAVHPIKSKFDATEAQQLEAQRLSGLEKLAGEGHDWLKTPEGLQKMSAVLAENPELWTSKDPYRAALGFIPDVPSKAGQRGNAQSTGLTPILGASGAMPPVVSSPVMSKLAKQESLLAEVDLLRSRGQWDQARAKLAEVDKLERGF